MKPKSRARAITRPVSAAPKRSRVTTKHDKLIRALCTLSEHDLTRRVLIPLLKASGYDQVEYNGGPNEEGKDIICHSTDVCGDLEVTVAQVKKYTDSVAARKQHTFNEIVTQLSQAAEKPVPTLAGAILPSEIFFFTPYIIDARGLSSRFEQYTSLRARRLKVIDGGRLVKMLLANAPHIIADLGCESDSLEKAVLNNLGNAPLLLALGTDSVAVDITEFYTDIDFALGQAATKAFFGASLVAQQSDHTISGEHWGAIQRANCVCKSYFGTPFLTEDEQVITSRAKAELQRFGEMRDRVHRRQEARKLIDKLVRTLSTRIKSLFEVWPKREKQRRLAGEAVLNAEFEVDRQNKACARSSQGTRKHLQAQSRLAVAAKRLVAARGRQSALAVEDYHPNDLKTILGIIMRPDGPGGSFDDSGIPDSRDFAELWLKWSRVCDNASRELRRKNDEIGGLIRQLVIAVNEERLLSKSLGRFADHAGDIRYRITINTHELCERLLAARGEVEESIASFNARAPSQRSMRIFLEKASALMSALAVVLDQELVRSAIGAPVGSAHSNRAIVSTRLSVSIQRVFDCARHLLVMGEAGAGKTTSLQMYARRTTGVGKTFCLYLPLGRMVSKWMSSEANRSGPPADRLESAIVEFIRSYESEWSVATLRAGLKGPRAILLLDGIDEVLRSANWICDGITELSERYPSAQIIVSTRAMGGSVPRLPFLPITLLPFRDEQQERFIQQWCKHDQAASLSKEIVEHLVRHPEVREVVRNPLLATVMCELAKHGIALPHTETRLYEDRIELLTGRYDTYKGGPRRIKTRHQDLSHISRQIAYYLHTTNQREEDREVLYEVATSSTKVKLRPAATRHAVDELIEQCEILVPMSDDGKFGFGHLRYQEFFVAQELARMQFSELLPLLESPWWRDTFVLYAKIVNEIDKFLEYVGQNRLGLGCFSTGLLMIQARPFAERKELMELLKGTSARALSSDVMQQLLEIDRAFNDEWLAARDAEERRLTESIPDSNDRF